LIDLPYPDDCTAFFEPLSDRDWAVWLDSAAPGIGQGRLDLIAALPRVTIVAHGREVEINEIGQPTRLVQGNPLTVLGDYLQGGGEDGYAGGALGYFAYDMARQFTPLPALAEDAEHLPDMAVGVYDGFVVLDHERRTCQIRAQDTPEGMRWAERMQALLLDAGERGLPEFNTLGPLRQNLAPDAYAGAFQKVRAYIRAGDCYQINLAIRFETAYQGHPWHAYKLLRACNPAPYAAWLNLPFAQILSASPESFLKVEGGRVVTRPIKGTRRRAQDPQADALLAAELSGSAKDRAENLMIVDLLRNDLGRVCIPGSIQVPELFKLERFATVHHLVSTVEGRLAPGKAALDLLEASFPGGSITGAPKRRAMEIIESLEPHRRGVYCGSIGHIGFNGDMELNIAIRTLVCSRGQARFWAGGGVVADSDLQAEYQECLDKAHALRQVLDSLRKPS
jgi:para-aminobenzoate synthetase component 1